MTESTVNRLLSRIVQLGIIGPVLSSFLKIIILDKIGEKNTMEWDTNELVSCIELRVGKKCVKYSTNYQWHVHLES